MTNQGPPPPPGSQPPWQPGQPAQPGQPPHPGPAPYGQPGPPGQLFPGQQAPGQGPAGYGQGPGFSPVPPKQRRKVWPWIVGILVVFVLLIGGCAALVFQAATGPIDKANDFLGHIDNSDFTTAFELTDPACFTADEYVQLEEFFTELELTAYDLTGTERFTGGGAATGTVTLEGVGERDVRIELTNDDGWRVCRIDVTEAGS